MPTVYLQYHGCQMNEYDSQKILDVLMQTHQLTRSPCLITAHVAILVTCSIRDKAQEKVFSELGRWREIKIKNPNLVIGVGGCVASQEGEAILKRAPDVSLIFGPQTIHRLGDMLHQYYLTRQPVIDIRFPEIEKFDYLPRPRAESPLASVTIMEGCNKYCSFCVVPYTRGEEISRPLDDVLAEVSDLVTRGVREITLLGQNVNDYRGMTYDGHIADLSMLIEYIAAMDPIVRIHFMTSHPIAFSSRLIQTYAHIAKLANHLHLPVQSGSDRILAMMKRGYSILEFKSKIRRLRKIRPNISLSSDFIVGFPGETDEDFEATLHLVEEIKFDYFYSFIYSPRPGTPAAQLPDNISFTIKKKRLWQLQEYLHYNGQRYNDAMLGSEQIVLISGVAPKKKGRLFGRTSNNRVVHFDGDTRWIGKVASIKIIEALRHTLKGELINLQD